MVYREKLLRSAFLIGVCIVVIQAILYITIHDNIFFEATSYLGVSLVFLWLIGKATDGFQGVIGKVMEWKPLLFIGQISYGMYLYHNFMPDFIIYFTGILDISHPSPRTIPMFLLASALTITVSTMSWFLIESPIKQLQERINFAK